ncbi:hypothetical protein ACH4TP_37970 [Streptomyces sp. NPDC021012]|uniref:hypothetical protein n=1 Tax=Streptomyces sp. NPDC021012 TaxID=3365107 RepID=UPI0037AF2C6F
MKRELAAHGTANRYKSGCKCRPCTKAATRADAERKLDRLAGRPRSVPVEPARQHIQALFARGLTSWQIGREAGVAPTTVVRLATTGVRAHRDTVTKILAVPLDVRVALGDVPAVGATRRLQALYVLGHPVTLIAEAAGISHDTVALLVAGRWQTLKVQLDDGIREAYAQLSMKTGTSWQTRQTAKANGWAPPLAWDEETLDDPDAKPNLGAEAPATLGEDIDEVAVRRYARGDRVEVTADERLLGIALCVDRGLAFTDVDRLHGHRSMFTSVFVSRMRRTYERDGRPFPKVLSQTAARVLTEDEVVAIRTRSAAGETDLTLGLAFGVRDRTIADVCLGRSYRQYGGPVREPKKGPSKASKTVWAGKTGRRAA